MKTYRMNAVLTGALYVIGTVSGIMSYAVTSDLRGGDDFLVKIAENPVRFTSGAFFILLMGLSLAAMPIFLYPLFRRRSESMAMGMVIFRGPLEGSAYLVSVISWLMLVVLGREMLVPGADEATLMTMGKALLQVSDVMGPVLSIIFIIGASFLYILFYLTGLIPRWLSVWGLAGAVLYLAYYLLKFFGIEFLPGPLLVPLAVQEMVMGIWLIVKGFDKSAVAELMPSGTQIH